VFVRRLRQARRLSQPHGIDEQMFGVKQQIPLGGGSYKEAEMAAQRHLVRWPS
jgi:hypothetical protein